MTWWMFIKKPLQFYVQKTQTGKPPGLQQRGGGGNPADTQTWFGM